MAKKILPIIGGRGYTGYRLDGKQCFELWVDRGSSKKASLVLYNELQIFNKRTKKPYTEAAVIRAAKFYIVENQKEARVIWEEKYGKVEDNIWYDYISRNSKILLDHSNKKYFNWRDNNPEIVAYEEENNISAFA